MNSIESYNANSVILEEHISHGVPCKTQGYEESHIIEFETALMALEPF